MQTTRSGRARIKPLPYWTNSRQVFNVKREVVGIEHKADLLGLSGEAPPRPASAPKGERLAGRWGGPWGWGGGLASSLGRCLCSG